MPNAFDQLLPAAQQVRDAVREGENSAERVGTLFVDLVNALSEGLYGRVGLSTLITALSNSLTKLSAQGLLSPSVTVEHKANSVRLSFPVVNADGSTATDSVSIGTVGIKAGLMLPNHVTVLEVTSHELGLLQSRVSRHDERLADHEEMIGDAEKKAISAQDQVLSLSYQHALDLVSLRDDIDVASRAVFNSLWLSAVGPYGGIDQDATDGHPYLLNGLRLTYEEAVAVLNYGKSDKWVEGMFAFAEIRTNIPRQSITSGFSLSQLCDNCHNIEVFRFVGNANGVPVGCDNLYRTFYYCLKLKSIKGKWSINSVKNGGSFSFGWCGALEEIEHLVIGRGVTAISFADCPKLSLSTLQGFVDNAESRSNTLTISLHPDAFARLTDELLAKAAEKQITFATA